MLRECLQSILQQTFGDFEVIVGNDYTREKLTGEMLGISDTRIRFVNYSRNIGPIKNANTLLAASRGRYFTWLADDDGHAPAFFQRVHDALHKHGYPECVYTSYVQGTAFPDSFAETRAEAQILDGHKFLRAYLSRELKLVGCYGAFASSYIREMGGMEHLGKGKFSPYCDNLIAIRAGSLRRVLYIDQPLVFFRAHPGSVSTTSPDVETYRTAQADLWCRVAGDFARERLRDDFEVNLSNLLEWCVRDMDHVVRRSGFAINAKQGVAYLLFVAKQIRRVKWLPHGKRIAGLVLKIAYALVREAIKTKLRGCAVLRSLRRSLRPV